MRPSVPPSPSALSHVATAPTAVAPSEMAMASQVTWPRVRAGAATWLGTAARARRSPTAAPVSPATNRSPAVDASAAPTAYRPTAPRTAAPMALREGSRSWFRLDGAALEPRSLDGDPAFAYRSE